MEDLIVSLPHLCSCFRILVTLWNLCYFFGKLFIFWECVKQLCDILRLTFAVSKAGNAWVRTQVEILWMLIVLFWYVLSSWIWMQMYAILKSQVYYNWTLQYINHKTECHYIYSFHSTSSANFINTKNNVTTNISTISKLAASIFWFHFIYIYIVISFLISSS